MGFVRPGMKLGLGTGSTARHFVDLVGEGVRRGLDVVCVPTSEATFRQAEALGVPLATLDEIPELDLTVDGADEIDPSLRLIKGGGGALLREKIVAASSRRMVAIADVDESGWRAWAASRCRSRSSPSACLDPSARRARRAALGLPERSRCAGATAVFRHRRRALYSRLRLRRDPRPGSARPRARVHPGRRRTRTVHRPGERRDRRRAKRRRDSRRPRLTAITAKENEIVSSSNMKIKALLGAALRRRSRASARAPTSRRPPR